MHDYDQDRGLAPLSLPPLSQRAQPSSQQLPALSPRDMPSPNGYSSYSQSNQLPPLTPIGLPQQHHNLHGHRESVSASGPPAHYPSAFPSTTYSDSAPQSRTHSVQHGPSDPPSPHSARYQSAGRASDRQPDHFPPSWAGPNAYNAPPQSSHTNPSTPTTASYHQHQHPQYGPPGPSTGALPPHSQDGYHVQTPTTAHPAAFGAQQMHHEPHYVLSAPQVVAYPGPGNGGIKKRTNRASQACDQCRSRKSKCNEGDPCTHCLQMGATCTYKDSGPPTKITDKTMVTALAEVLDAVKGPLASLEQKVDSLNTRLTHLQHIVQQTHPVGHRLDDMDDDPRWHRRNSTQDTVDSPEACRNDDRSVPPQQNKAGFDNFDGHTTAAHKLIQLWPSVYSMLKDDPPAADYAHQAESRDSLQLFGTGDYSSL